MVQVYIGIGSNLDNPQQQVSRAVAAIKSLASTGSLSVSRLYGSKAIGPGPQPDYINAVVRLLTPLSAIDLLRQLQQIEQHQGRQRGEQAWMARSLDLDLLLYADQTINTEQLQVPHPHIAERQFVLQPLRDLQPDLQIQGLGKLSDLIDDCSVQAVWPLANDCDGLLC